MPRTALRTVGRPSSRSVLERAHDLPPIVSVGDLKALLEISKSHIYAVTRKRISGNFGGKLPRGLPRLGTGSPCRWLREDVIAWVRGEGREE